MLICWMLYRLICWKCIDTYIYVNLNLRNTTLLTRQQIIYIYTIYTYIIYISYLSMSIYDSKLFSTGNRKKFVSDISATVMQFNS